jgi:hypothetical protein
MNINAALVSISFSFPWFLVMLHRHELFGNQTNFTQSVETWCLTFYMKETKLNQGNGLNARNVDTHDCI